jgi:hypothetical protein
MLKILEMVAGPSVVKMTSVGGSDIGVKTGIFARNAMLLVLTMTALTSFVGRSFSEVLMLRLGMDELSLLLSEVSSSKKLTGSDIPALLMEEE